MALNYAIVPMPDVTRSRLIGNVILVAITLFVVSLRILTRLVTGSKLGWDDYFILLCVPQGIGLLICQGLCKYHICNPRFVDCLGLYVCNVPRC